MGDSKSVRNNGVDFSPNKLPSSAYIDELYSKYIPNSMYVSFKMYGI